MLIGERSQLFEIALAPDERRYLRREVVCGRIERSRRQKLRSKAGGDDLEYDLGFAEIFEAMRPQVAQF